GRGMVDLIAYLDLNRRLGNDPAASTSFNDHQQIQKLERRMILRLKPTHQKLEACLGGFELEALAFKLLERVQQHPHVPGIPAQIHPELLGFDQNVAS